MTGPPSTRPLHWSGLLARLRRPLHLLADRFPVSEAYQSRNPAIQQEALERDPEYLKYLPRAEEPLPLPLQKGN